MKPEEGYCNQVSSSYRHYSVFDLSDLPRDLRLLQQGSIDARSSRPLVKEDDVDRERRHEFAEKQKSTKDLEKKKEKKKNLERQALEKRRVKSRQRGSPRRTLLTRTMGMRATTIATTPRGWRLTLTGSLKTRREPTSIPRGRGFQEVIRWCSRRATKGGITAPPSCRDSSSAHVRPGHFPAATPSSVRSRPPG